MHYNVQILILNLNPNFTIKNNQVNFFATKLNLFLNQIINKQTKKLINLMKIFVIMIIYY